MSRIFRLCRRRDILIGSRRKCVEIRKWNYHCPNLWFCCWNVKISKKTFFSFFLELQTHFVCTTVSHAKFCLSLLAFRPCKKISFRHWINPPSPSRRPFNSFTGEFSILIKIWILLTEIWRFCWRSSRDLSRWRIDDWLFLCVDKRVNNLSLRYN